MRRGLQGIRGLRTGGRLRSGLPFLNPPRRDKSTVASRAPKGFVPIGFHAGRLKVGEELSPMAPGLNIEAELQHGGVDPTGGGPQIALSPYSAVASAGYGTPRDKIQLFTAFGNPPTAAAMALSIAQGEPNSLFNPVEVQASPHMKKVLPPGTDNRGVQPTREQVESSLSEMVYVPVSDDENERVLSTFESNARNNPEAARKIRGKPGSFNRSLGKLP